jgi:hypothetical protein
MVKSFNFLNDKFGEEIMIFNGKSFLNNFQILQKIVCPPPLQKHSSHHVRQQKKNSSTDVTFSQCLRRRRENK